MLFEQYHAQDLLTPSINDGGINKLNSSLSSLDFYLLDDIDAYLSPIQSKSNENDLNNDSIHENNQHQEHDIFFPDFDFSEFSNFKEETDFIPLDEIELEEWISQSSFPSPPMDTSSSPPSSIDDGSSPFSCSGDQYPINVDMVVPPSPPLSTLSASPALITKKPKLSVVERKLRKKGQNKTAAEKYRTKKKSERNLLLDRHLHVKNINKKLKLELENLTYRVQQFQQLCAGYIQSN